MNYDKLLINIRNHFEATTGLITKSTRMRVQNKEWFDTHKELNNLTPNCCATHKDFNTYQMITVKDDLIEKDLIITILHELTHQFHSKHDNHFYNLLAQTGVYIGPHFNNEYRIEGFTSKLQGLLK